MIDEVLDEAELDVHDVDVALGVQGPGSFTGLRVGLATLLGLHQSLGIKATAVPTFEILAWQARAVASVGVAVVDALRNEWFSCRFELGERPRRLEEPLLRSPSQLVELDPDAVLGFGVERLAELGVAASRIAEAQPLASAMISYAARVAVAWEPGRLTSPLYLRPPATTPPKPRRV